MANRKVVQLPRFNPNATVDPDTKLMTNYIQMRDASRKRRIRNQRLGDITLGGLFMLVGFITVQMIAGIGR